MAWLMALRSMARLAARRTRLSYQGDFGSHWSSMLIHCGAWMTVGFRVSPGVRSSSSASSPRIEYTTSTSPRFNAASRVVSSVIDLEDEALHARRLAPVPVEGLHDQLDARGEGDELVGPGADGRLLVPVLADLLDVLLGHDPARAAGRGVERHEVGPRVLQPEPHVEGTGRLHGGHAVLEGLGGGAPVALERELHVLGGEQCRRCGTSRPCAG